MIPKVLESGWELIAGLRFVYFGAWMHQIIGFDSFCLKIKAPDYYST